MSTAKLEILITANDQASAALRNLENNFGTLFKAAKVVGAGMVASGAAIAGALGVSTKAAINFEAGMASVNSMLQLNRDDLNELSEQTLELSRSLGIDAVQATDALYQAISSGIPQENAVDFLAVASKAAIAGVTSTVVAVDGLTTVLNSFKLPATEARTVADQMFKTVELGKTTFEELSATMANVAPIAASAGWEFSEVAAALATMTKQGVPTATATTQLRQVIAQLLKPSAEAIEVIDKFGLSLYNETVESKKAKDAIPPLQQALQAANRDFAAQTLELDKLKAAYQATTAEIDGMTEELDELGDQQAAIRLRIRQIRFEAAKEDRELTEQEQATIKELELALEDLGIQYDALNIKRDDLQEAADKELETLKAAQAENETLAKNITDTTSALEKAISAYSESAKDVKSLPEIIGEITEKDLPTSEIIKLFGSIQASSAIMSLAGKNAEMYASDLAAVKRASDGAGAATAAFNVINESTKRQYEELENKISAVLIKTGEGLIPVLGDLLDAVTPLIDCVSTWIQDNQSLFNTLVKITAGVAAFLVPVGGMLVAFSQLQPLIALTTKVMTEWHVVSKLVTAAQWLWNAALSANPIGIVITAIGALVAAGVALYKNWDTVCEWAGKVRDWFVDIYNTVKEKVMKALEWLKERLEWVLLPIAPLVSGIILLIKNWDKVVEVAKRVAEWFINLRDTIIEFGKNALDWIVGKIEGVINWFKDLRDTVGGIISTIGGWFGVGNNEMSITATTQTIAANAAIPSFDTGGYVASTGLAMVHEGEYVIPRDGLTIHSHIDLDGEQIGEAVERIIAQKLRAQGY